ncbi:MAG: monovalent cation/H(+) antiporter subunit G [Gemmatimonadales bacterium]|nr:MAG: monovalent cation/H(+) antiporter subunit G [Gemmatimonadales bacterium]
MTLELVVDGLTVLFLLTGCFFFLAGTVGLLRFPDVYCRLHALTKADSLGLGFVVAGVALQLRSWHEVLLLGILWFLVLSAAATICYLVASEALAQGVDPVGSGASQGQSGTEEAP